MCETDFVNNFIRTCWKWFGGVLIFSVVPNNNKKKIVYEPTIPTEMI